MRLPLLTILLAAFCFPSLLSADDLKIVQAQLYSLGLYRGQVDGKLGAECETALRRFQIESGLKVSGQADAETRAALNSKFAANRVSTVPAAADKPIETRAPASRLLYEKPVARPAEPPAAPETNQARKIAMEDATYLNQQAAPVPVQPETSAPRRERLTNEEFLQGALPPEASKKEQRAAIVAVQERLRGEGLYKGTADGAPGPKTQEALGAFQLANSLPSTGRLDEATWGLLALTEEDLAVAQTNSNSRARSSSRSRGGARGFFRRVRSHLPF